MRLIFEERITNRRPVHTKHKTSPQVAPRPAAIGVENNPADWP